MAVIINAGATAENIANHESHCVWFASNSNSRVIADNASPDLNIKIYYGRKRPKNPKTVREIIEQHAKRKGVLILSAVVHKACVNIIGTDANRPNETWGIPYNLA